MTPLQRLEPEHLKAAHEARMRFARERQTLTNLGVYEDFRAVIHIHADDSDHTKGTRQEVLDAAKKSGVRVVMFTDHHGPLPETWHGLRDGVLFIAGSEDDDGVLRFPNFDANRKPLPDGELRFLSQIEDRYDAATTGFTGMEICNRHTDAKIDNRFYDYLNEAANYPDKWRKVLENFKAYPDECFAAGSDHRPEVFAKWDRETQTNSFTGIAANDAHQNRVIGGTTIDPYDVSFRHLSTHILARGLTEPEIRRALRDGNVYVSHDWLCDPTGFAFGAANNLGVYPMGDTIPFLGTTRLAAVTPLAAKLKLIYNGKVVEETTGTNLNFSAKDAGAYRLEAWLTVDGEERPWIYSNPVYIKTPSAQAIRLPSTAISSNVEVKKDIVYIEGKPEDEGKHKLDLYLPKDKKSPPVFFFIHGGAWRFGDRAQYPAVGNRFAKEGLLTVVPSYRLAPKNPHPAQIEDVAAAFAWVVKHISEYGGDMNRIYVGGHSAGGHLSALLTLDEKYLKPYNLSQKNIRGTICLSGVFNLGTGDSQASVFGTDGQARKDASPLNHIKDSEPPFLVTYCQWDYLTLPAQARQFHAALRKAGLKSELIFVAHESHISEMLSITHDDDPLALAILKFVR
ncbi:MAG: alpha/beta hydrolase fold domain-containing protein [Verrucomicrobia bacterium]|nr:alpha/beta hydrolase fold domain-containing protein [Verrucomicrobiota bacterium]